MSVPDTVIVLGAGASAAEGAPTQATIFREYFKYHRTETGYAIHHTWNGELATFFDQFFGIDVDDDDLDSVLFPTFEEILGILEIAESQDESFRDWPGAHLIKDGTSRIRHIHDLLVFLIGEVLHHTLTNPPHAHSRLLGNLDELGQLATTAVIDFNYDILADNAMLDSLGGGHTDYGIGFVNQERPRVDDPRRMMLLKPHGSLNWLYCSTCRDLEITPHEKGVMRIKWEPQKTVCERCETPRSPIIIPPTYFKVMSNLALRQIWDTAERACQDAQRLIFCGYSFPDADVHVRYLLKRAERNGQQTPEVFVVSNHPGKPLEAAKWEAERYRRFFINKGSIHYTDCSFEEFSSNPYIVEDESRWLP